MLVRLGRDRPTGKVEVDETHIVGDEEWLTGRRARGKKVLTCTAVAILEPKGFGRCRMRLLDDATVASLQHFVTDFVEPRATVITDGWKSYCGLDQLGYIHCPRSPRAARTRAEDPGELPPGVYPVASLATRWLLGTHQGSVDSAHLASSLNEFVFRLTRRRSRSRGKVFKRVLDLTVAHEPVPYKELAAGQQSRAIPRTPPRASGPPPTLDRPPVNRPWLLSG